MVSSARLWDPQDHRSIRCLLHLICLAFDGRPQKMSEEEALLGLALAEGAPLHVCLGAVPSQDRTHEVPRICPTCYYSQIKSYFVGNFILTFEVSSQTEILFPPCFSKNFLCPQ